MSDNIMRFNITNAELGCRAVLDVDLDAQDPDYWSQFDTRGEGVEQLIIDAVTEMAKKIRKEYDRRDSINSTVDRMGKQP